MTCYNGYIFSWGIMERKLDVDDLIGDENGNIELVSKLCELAEPAMPIQ